MPRSASWTFDDDDAELRQAARSAARAAGMSVGEWLAEMGQHESGARRAERRSFRAKSHRAHEVSPLDRVIERLDADRGTRSGALSGERLAAALMSIEDRIRASEEKTAAALLQIGARLGDAAPAKPTPTTRPEPQRRAVDDTALTGTLAQIAGRLGDIERRIAQPKADPTAAIQRSLRDLEAKLATLPAQAAEQAAQKTASRIETREPPEAIRTIESKLGAILDHLNKPAPAAPTPPQRPRMGLTPQSLGSAVADIGQRQRKLDTDVDLARQTEAIERLRSELGEITRRLGERPAADASLSAIRDEVATLSRTLATRTGEAEGIADLRDELKSLGRAIDGLAPRHLVASIDVAMQDLVQRINRSRDEGVREVYLRPIEMLLGELKAQLDHLREPQSLRELSLAVRGLMDRLDGLAARGPDPQALRGIETQIAELRNVVGRPQERGDLDAIATEVAGLGRKLDQLAIRPDDRTLGREIAGGIDEIRRLLGAMDPGGQLARIEARLDDLARRLDRQPVDGVADRLLEQLDSRLETRLNAFARDVEQHLAQVVHPATDPGGADLATAEIADRIDRLAALVEAGTPPATPQPADLSALEPMLQSLIRRIESSERSAAPPVDVAVIDGLQRDIARVMAHLEQAPAPGPEVRQLQEMVERLVGDLAARERETAAIAEAAARRVAEGLTSGSGAVDQTAVHALQQELVALKDSHAQAERRNQATLEAVHDTLERMIDRLVVIEKDVRQPPAAPHTAVSTRTADPSGPIEPPGLPAGSLNQPAGSDQRVIAAEPRGASPAPATSQTIEKPAPMPDLTGSAPPSAIRAAMMASQSTIPPVLPSDEAPMAPRKPAARSPVAAALEAARDAVGALRPSSPGRGAATPIAPPAAAPAPATPPALTAPAEKPVAQGRPAADLGLDLPLEPGSGRPSGQPKATAPTPLGVADTEDPKASFIAAARRAAQAAAAQSADYIAEEKQAGAAHAKVADIKAGGVRRKHVLLLGLAALVVIVGATVQILSMRKPTPTMAGTMPRAIEAPAVPAVDPAPAQPVPPPVTGAPPVEPPKTNERVSAAPQQTDPRPVGSIAPPARPAAAAHILDPADPLVRFEGLIGGERLRQAALSGDPAAFYELGARFAEGRGARRDPRVAIQWLEKAAALGSAPADYRLGGHHREGRGTERNPRLALDHFLRAAEAGHSRAMHNVAVLLAEGVRGSPDYAGAGQWFRRAADLGVRDSQYNLAILHARGLGVPQDMVASYAWFAAAARQGDEDAAKKRDEVGARLSPEQLKQAMAAAAAWRPITADPTANANPTPQGGWDDAVPRTAPQQQARPRPNRG